MNDEPYLILHKVRGEPAFDIAIQLKIGDEDGWIIPTSGHRAYPQSTWRLMELGNLQADTDRICKDWLADWPDHYGIIPEPSRPKINLLKLIGCERPPITRRV